MIESSFAQLSLENLCHNFVDITHSNHDILRKVWDILGGKGGNEGDERGRTDIFMTSFEDNSHSYCLSIVINEQVSEHFVKDDWFFIMEMQNMTLFSSWHPSTFKEVFYTCLTAYNDGNKTVFDENRDKLMTMSYRDCWKECRYSFINNGVRITFKRKCLDVALPPFESYNRLTRHGFTVMAGYWCHNFDNNSGAWDNGEHIHMDSDLTVSGMSNDIL